MYKKELLSLSLIFILFSGISAEESVSTELTKVENFYKTKNSPDPNPDAMIRENLASALKLAVIRHLPNGKKKAEGIHKETIKFDQIEDSNLVVTVFEDYVFEFRFGANPRKYHISPVSHRYFKKDKEWQNSGSKLNEKVEKKQEK